MFGHRKSESLLMVDPEALEGLQETTRQMVQGMQEAAANMQASIRLLTEAAKEVNKATAELKKANKKRSTIIRNHQ